MLLARRGLCLLALLPALGGCHLIVSTNDLVLVGSTAKKSDSGATMDNAVVSLAFDPAVGWALSDARIKGARNQNLLYTGTETKERLAGISYFEHSFSWENTSATADSLAVLEAGGPIARVKITWATSDMNGTSLYTLHPDGRLHRDERVTVTTGSCCPPPTCPTDASCSCCDADPSSCLASCTCCQGPGQCPKMCLACDNACQGWHNASSFLLAYTAVAPELLPNAEWSVAGSVHSSTYPADPTVYSDTASYGCAYDPTNKDVVSWAHHPPAAPSPSFAEWRFVLQSGSYLLATDWVNESSVAATDFTGQFMNLFASSGDCRAVPAQAAAFQQPPTLTPASALSQHEDGDRDTDGYNEGGGFYELQASNGVVAATMPSGATLPTTTLHIQGTPSAGSPTVTLGGERLVEGKDYLVGRSQSLGSVTWLHLARPWADGAELSIHW